MKLRFVKERNGVRWGDGWGLYTPDGLFFNAAQYSLKEIFEKHGDYRTRGILPYYLELSNLLEKEK